MAFEFPDGWGKQAFYQPGNTYGASFDWYDTPLVRENEPESGAFQRWLTDQGVSGFGRKDRFGQMLYGRTQSGYAAAASSNPMLTYRDYLSTLQPGFVDQIWQTISPEERGMNPGRFAGNARILGRG